MWKTRLAKEEGLTISGTGSCVLVPQALSPIARTASGQRRPGAGTAPIPLLLTPVQWPDLSNRKL